MRQSQLKKIKQTVKDNRLSLDEIQQHIYDVVSINALTNEQMAALFMSVFMQALDKPHNKQILNDIGVQEVNLDIATILIKTWTEMYAKKLNDTQPVQEDTEMDQ